MINSRKRSLVLLAGIMAFVSIFQLGCVSYDTAVNLGFLPFCGRVTAGGRGIEGPVNFELEFRLKRSVDTRNSAPNWAANSIWRLVGGATIDSSGVGCTGLALQLGGRQIYALHIPVGQLRNYIELRAVRVTIQRTGEIIGGTVLNVDMNSGEEYGYAEGVFDRNNPNPATIGELAYGRRLRPSSSQSPSNDVADRSRQQQPGQGGQPRRAK